jgi:hypothetical protein
MKERAGRGVQHGEFMDDSSSWTIAGSTEGITNILIASERRSN